MLLYGWENWTLIKEHETKNDRAETKFFFMSVAGYIFYDHGTNEEIRGE